MKLNSKPFQIFNSLLLTAGTLLFAPSVMALNSPQNSLSFSQTVTTTTPTTNFQLLSSSPQLAYEFSTRITCPDNADYFVAGAETAHYVVLICGTPGNNEFSSLYYVGYSKNNGKGIVLPAYANKSFTVFTAKNKGYTYSLDTNGKQFSIIFPNKQRSVERVRRLELGSG